ncbi:MAG TPA: MFS transporter [Candidatus Rifleibacterium sp.]|nr:MFS transporter [Candidatus Rifleibacterium sp.]HPT46681.1 MFS transporter [Candidatus Rifleibacterium sp.]
MITTGPSWHRIVLPFAAGYFLSYLLRNVNAIIAPELTRDLAVSAADLGLLTSVYLLAFAAFQLPLGILLDRYGPRRVEITLLLVAAAGCLLFAHGRHLHELAVGRALIGLGVSACLMASFKAFSQWYPAGQQASLNSAVMAAGGLGSLTATTPIAWALPLAGWRGIFIGLAGLAVAVAAGIFTTPEKPAPPADESSQGQWRAVGDIITSRVFWRIAPQSAVVSGGFMALQGLWAVPWLMTFNGCSRDAAAFHLLLASVAMLIGFITLAAAAVPLARIGITSERLLVNGIGLGVLVMGLIVTGVGPTHLLWFIMGLIFSISNLSYALLSEHFPANLSGRVNTVLNVFVLGGAFGLQWGIGLLLDMLGASGYEPRAAFRITFGVMLALQAVSWLCLIHERKHHSPITSSKEVQHSHH